MDEKISLEAIARYADSYSEKVIRAFFAKKDNITGSEILNFCNIHQVNLLIIKELFKSWKEENRKIKSPYFDYDSQEVKDAIENLMNILSRNILIAPQHFTPLVKKAVNQALLVIFDPYDYYAMVLTGTDNTVEVAAFREDLKYLKVNKGPLERTLQRLEEKNVETISGNEALGILDNVLEEVNFTPEDVDPYIEKFSIVAALDPNDFYVSHPQSTPTVSPQKEEPRISKAEPAPATRVQAPPPSPIPAVTIHEKVKGETRPTIADNFQRIRKIKDSLTINQKFMFTKVLFHGDFELFSKAVDRLDQLDSLPQALRYIEEEHASTWDRDSEEFHEFMELIEKRFS